MSCCSVYVVAVMGGPIVRVPRDEPYVNDPYFYEQINAGHGQKCEPDKHIGIRAGTKYALNVTQDHDVHHQHRGYIPSLFPKESITELGPSIHPKVNTEVAKLKEAHHNGEVIVSTQFFGALTTGIMTLFAHGQRFEELEKPGFPCPLQQHMNALVQTIYMGEYLPVVSAAFQLLPETILRRLAPSVASFLDLNRILTVRAIVAIKDKDARRNHPDKHGTLFDAPTDPKAPAHEQTFERLRDESKLVLLAGVHTTARSLTAIMCLLVSYPDILANHKQPSSINPSAGPVS
ncbi:cytochrome P450 [Plenodomus tracheiphilus IPT5]|uniref:Cytochrome P450 n=1 Tax=Plenodomus tracheiphilus IPT5 TaxID=1408161 RepID=A0A6A7B8A5_9PLEO|nr:cytochrome P450 [Plenodomus tracheiphilus IPT5]